MPRKPKNVEEVVSPEAKEPVVEAEVAVSAAPAVDLGTLGPLKRKILSLRKKTINGVEFNEVQIEDRSTYLLSDNDLANQINK